MQLLFPLPHRKDFRLSRLDWFRLLLILDNNNDRDFWFRQCSRSRFAHDLHLHLFERDETGNFRRTKGTDDETRYKKALLRDVSPDIQPISMRSWTWCFVSCPRIYVYEADLFMDASSKLNTTTVLNLWFTGLSFLSLNSITPKKWTPITILWLAERSFHANSSRSNGVWRFLLEVESGWRTFVTVCWGELFYNGALCSLQIMLTIGSDYFSCKSNQR